MAGCSSAARPHDLLDGNLTEIHDVVQDLSFLSENLGGANRILDGLFEVLGFECRFHGDVRPENPVQEVGGGSEHGGDRVEDPDGGRQRPHHHGCQAAAKDHGQAFGDDFSKENDADQAGQRDHRGGFLCCRVPRVVPGRH
ncbi:MAG: hypothetical protein CM1200mP2_47560 [Planctomycetaceae bacterium]|nr:MAG: hypothetical protein CM1200mP2_47560 [Planctomycetaceae bacterium]